MHQIPLQILKIPLQIDNLQRDFEEFTRGVNAFGSAATDVSTFWLKSACCQDDNVDLSQNAETTVHAQPNAHITLQSPYNPVVNLSARSAATDVSAFRLKSTWCQENHIDFNQNAETSVAAEPNAHLPLQIP